MLSEQQRDMLVTLYNDESDPAVKALIQSFSGLHSTCEADPVLTKVSVDLFSHSLELKEAGHLHAAYCISSLASSMMREGAITVLSHAIRATQDHIAAMEVAANIAAQLVQKGIVQPKKKRKRKKGPSGEQGPMS